MDVVYSLEGELSGMKLPALVSVGPTHTADRRLLLLPIWLKERAFLSTLMRFFSSACSLLSLEVEKTLLQRLG
jgi:hypothetical protein